jgi:hypothetical protein
VGVSGVHFWCAGPCGVLEKAHLQSGQQQQQQQDIEAAMARQLDQQVCYVCSGAPSGSADVLVLVRPLTGQVAATVAAPGGHELHQQMHSSCKGMLCVLCANTVSMLKHSRMLVCGCPCAGCWCECAVNTADS